MTVTTVRGKSGELAAWLIRSVARVNLKNGAIDALIVVPKVVILKAMMYSFDIGISGMGTSGCEHHLYPAIREAVRQRKSSASLFNRLRIVIVEASV